MFARFDENPAMTLRVIKETKRYGRTDGRTDARTDNVKTVCPLQTKFAGGIITYVLLGDNMEYISIFNTFNTTYVVVFEKCPSILKENSSDGESYLDYDVKMRIISGHIYVQSDRHIS